jgi:RNA polymerase sigma-70 factor (ECF subfamily)
MPVPQSRPDDLAAKLSTEYGHRLRAFACRRLRDPAAAEDVAQEALRRALVALREDRVANLEALPGFLFETARHICQQRLRSSGRETRALERVAREPPTPQSAADPLAQFLDEQQIQKVRQGLAELSTEERDLLLWSYRDGLDARTIGARLGVQPGAIRVRRHRAVQRLRALLGVTLPTDRQP